MSVPGSTYARGYDRKHQQLRDWWKPKVEAGEIMCFAIHCLMPTRWILPSTPWDLGHLPDRTGWTGPEHQRCNRAEGARRGNRLRRRRFALTADRW